MRSYACGTEFAADTIWQLSHKIHTPYSIFMEYGATKPGRAVALCMKEMRSLSPCCPFQGKYLRQQGKGFQNPSVTATPCQLPYEGSQGSHVIRAYVISNVVRNLKERDSSAHAYFALRARAVLR